MPQVRRVLKRKESQMVEKKALDRWYGAVGWMRGSKKQMKSPAERSMSFFPPISTYKASGSSLAIALPSRTHLRFTVIPRGHFREICPLCPREKGVTPSVWKVPWNGKYRTGVVESSRVQASVLYLQYDAVLNLPKINSHVGSAVCTALYKP
jgi:hypothetical protein